jgi:hypothetical protein
VKPYEHDVDLLPASILDDLQAMPEVSAPAVEMARPSLNLSGRNFSLVMAATAPTYAIGDRLTIHLAYNFLKHGAWVQYTACSRHPVEFILALKSLWEGKPVTNMSWAEAAKRMIVVNAFTSHFGFTDSIHLEMSRWLKAELRVSEVTAKPTFAGIHTGTARAFNQLKKRQRGSTPRPATLVCYEGVFALTDIESVEQYRVFIRHVATSERLWGGMLTLFIEEASCPQREIALLQSYASLFVQLPATGTAGETQG